MSRTCSELNYLKYSANAMAPLSSISLWLMRRVVSLTWLYANFSAIVIEPDLREALLSSSTCSLDKLSNEFAILMALAWFNSFSLSARWITPTCSSESQNELIDWATSSGSIDYSCSILSYSQKALRRSTFRMGRDAFYLINPVRYSLAW